MIMLLLPALAATASFDHVAEGVSSRSVTEDGITLTNLWNALDPPPGVMSVEQADGSLTGMPGFSAPNVLGFGGYAPGNGAAFGRFASLEITGPPGHNAARVEVFDFFNSGVTLRLEGWAGGQVVAVDEVPLQSFVVTHNTLQVQAPRLDLVKLVCGPVVGDVCFITIDDVTFEERGGDTGLDTAAAVETDAPDTDAPDTDEDPPELEGADDTDRATADSDDEAPPAPAEDSDPALDPALDSDPTGDPDPQPDLVKEGEEAAAGCGCASGGPGSPPALLFGLLLLRRRR